MSGFYKNGRWQPDANAIAAGEYDPPGTSCSQNTYNGDSSYVIGAEGSRLLMEVFNRMTYAQKKKVPPELSLEIGDFMVKNGYRFVFNKWYLQAEPDSE